MCYCQFKSNFEGLPIIGDLLFDMVMYAFSNEVKNRGYQCVLCLLGGCYNIFFLLFGGSMAWLQGV